MLSAAIRLLALLVLVNNFDFIYPEPTWQSLRATWGLNLLSSRVFAKLPKNENKARSEGFAKLAGECSDKFLGKRYMKGMDTSAVLIYDVNGFIAGIQQGIPKNDVEKMNSSFSFSQSPAYQLDKILGEEEVYFVTTYFVDPSIICSSGRSQIEYDEQGIGTGLYVQNGTNPLRDTIEVPLYEKDLNGTEWVRGGCFRTMGVHYWWRVNEDMECVDFFPLTAIYNRGKVTSFAFVNFGRYEFSRRFEHPSSSSFSLFMPESSPHCLSEQYNIEHGGYSTMHVFFSIRPWNILC